MAWVCLVSCPLGQPVVGGIPAQVPRGAGGLGRLARGLCAGLSPQVEAEVTMVALVFPEGGQWPWTHWTGRKGSWALVKGLLAGNAFDWGAKAVLSRLPRPLACPAPLFPAQAQSRSPGHRGPGWPQPLPQLAQLGPPAVGLSRWGTAQAPLDTCGPGVDGQ